MEVMPDISWTWPWMDTALVDSGGHIYPTYNSVHATVERVKPVGVGQWSSYCSEICTPVLHSVSNSQLSNTNTVSFLPQS